MEEEWVNRPKVEFAPFVRVNRLNDGMRSRDEEEEKEEEEKKEERKRREGDQMGGMEEEENTG